MLVVIKLFCFNDYFVNALFRASYEGGLAQTVKMAIEITYSFVVKDKKIYIYSIVSLPDEEDSQDRSY